MVPEDRWHETYFSATNDPHVGGNAPPERDMSLPPFRAPFIVERSKELAAERVRFYDSGTVPGRDRM